PPCRWMAASCGVCCSETVSIARNLLLAASTNQWLRERATRMPFVRRSVARFMPGEDADAALSAAKVQRGLRIGTILTRLGEEARSRAEAEAVTQHYLDLFDRIDAVAVDAHVSIKPTQLGLGLDTGLCHQHVERLVDRARDPRRLLWIDMENARY